MIKIVELWVQKWNVNLNAMRMLFHIGPLLYNNKFVVSLILLLVVMMFVCACLSTCVCMCFRFVCMYTFWF